MRLEYSDEKKRWQCEAYKQLGHLEKNSFEKVKHSEDFVELLRDILDLPAFCAGARALLIEAGSRVAAEKLVRDRGHSRMALLLAKHFC